MKRLQIRRNKDRQGWDVVCPYCHYIEPIGMYAAAHDELELVHTCSACKEQSVKVREALR